MKIKEKMKNFIISLALLLFSYSICSLDMKYHQYVSKRKSFCGIPFYIIVIFAFFINFFIYN